MSPHHRILVALLLCFAVLGSAGTARAASPSPSPSAEPSPSPSASPHASPSSSPELSSSPTPTASPSPTPTESPSPADPPPPSPSPSASPEGGDEGDDADPPSPRPDEGGTLVLTAESRPLAAQLGDPVSHSLFVSNPGADTVRDVTIVALVPEELTVVSVPVINEADAIQLGRSEGREDIVWKLEAIEAGETVELPWTARAIALGDFVAVSDFAGRVGADVVAREESTTYLGDVTEREVDEGVAPSLVKRVITFVRRPVVEAAAGLLPVTGRPPGTVAIVALGMLGAGLLCLWLSRYPWKRVRIAFLATFVLLTGCVASEPETADRPGSVLAPTPSSPGGDKEASDRDARVKGRRIRNDRRGARPGGEVPDGERPEARAAESRDRDTLVIPRLGEPPRISFELVPRVRTVEVEELPLVLLPSLDAGNTLTYRFDAGRRRVTEASSSTVFRRGGLALLETALSTGRGHIEVRVSLTNVSPDKRIRMVGRLMHVVSSAGAAVARFESEPIDVTLAPEGTIEASFSYLVPTGDYVADASFRAR